MSTMPDNANPHDLSSRGRIVVEPDTMTENIQTGGVSVSNNNTYHPGSHHSNPIFYGNTDGSPTIVYYNQGPMLDPARVRGHFGPAMHAQHEERPRPVPPPYQPQPRSFQYQSGGRGARHYRSGPPPPPPPRPAPLRSGAGGVYATQQQRSSHGLQNEAQDSRYQDPQYQDSQYYDPRYSQYQDPQGRDPQYEDSQYPQHPHPQHQRADLPSPNSHTEYPPPSASTHGSTALPSPPHARAQSYATSLQASYSRSNSTSSNGVSPQAQRQDTHDNMPSQSLGLPPEHHSGLGASPPHPYEQEEEEDDRSEGRVVVQEEANLPTLRPPSFAPVPVPALPAAAEQTPIPSPAQAPASIPPVQASVAESPPLLAMNEPQHQECDGIPGHTAPANAGTPSSSGHSHLAESSTKSSEKGKDKEKSKRSGWMYALFKGNSKMESGAEGPSGDETNESESKSRSKRGSILGFGKKWDT